MICVIWDTEKGREKRIKFGFGPPKESIFSRSTQQDLKSDLYNINMGRMPFDDKMVSFNIVGIFDFFSYPISARFLKT